MKYKSLAFLCFIIFVFSFVPLAHAYLVSVCPSMSPCVEVDSCTLDNTCTTGIGGGSTGSTGGVTGGVTANSGNTASTGGVCSPSCVSPNVCTPSGITGSVQTAYCANPSTINSGAAASQSQCVAGTTFSTGIFGNGGPGTQEVTCRNSHGDYINVCQGNETVGVCAASRIDPTAAAAAAAELGPGCISTRETMPVPDQTTGLTYFYAIACPDGSGTGTETNTAGTTYPPGCTATTAYSVTTGLRCTGGTTGTPSSGTTIQGTASLATCISSGTCTDQSVQAAQTSGLSQAFASASSTTATTKQQITSSVQTTLGNIKTSISSFTQQFSNYAQSLGYSGGSGGGTPSSPTSTPTPCPAGTVQVGMTQSIPASYICSPTTTTTTTPAPGSAVCSAIPVDLQKGDTGINVSTLTTVLAAEGIITTPTSTFDDSVFSAVVTFQERHSAVILTPIGLTAGTGFVGTSTRAYINTYDLYACNNLLHPTAGGGGGSPTGSGGTGVGITKTIVATGDTKTTTTQFSTTFEQQNNGGNGTWFTINVPNFNFGDYSTVPVGTPWNIKINGLVPNALVKMADNDWYSVNGTAAYKTCSSTNCGPETGRITMGYADAQGVFTMSGTVQSGNHYQAWWTDYPLTTLKAMSPSNYNWTGYTDQVDILLNIDLYNGTGVASTPASTLPTPPTPTASCPSPGTTATISWSAVSGADYYSVWAYDQSGTQILNKASVTGTSASFTTSPGNYTYYVNLHQNGNWYPGSSKSFTCTGTAVSTPTPPTPTASCPSPGTTATISWSAVSGADYYSVWAYDQTGTQVLNKGSVTGTSASFTTSPGNYTYYVNLHQNGNWYQGSSKSLTCTL